MTTHPPSASPARDEFQTGQIATITGGHTVHDAFSAFFPPLLPHIQTQLGLSYSQIGHVNAIMQIPFLLTLVLGWLADRFSIRYFVIFTPGITATLVVCLGILPSYPLLLAATLLLGLSVAAFHAPAPAMISNVSGRRVGLGMSLFMGTGELGRTIGPLVAAVGVAWIGVQGLWQLCIVGWLTTAALYWRLHMVGAKSQQRATPHSLQVFVAQAAPMMALLTLMVVGRTFLQTAFTTYLPLYMRDVRGLTTFTEGAVTLSILEGAGVLGALLAGYLADHVPRRALLLTAFCFATPLGLGLHPGSDGIHLLVAAGGGILLAVHHPRHLHHRSDPVSAQPGPGQCLVHEHGSRQSGPGQLDHGPRGRCLRPRGRVHNVCRHRGPWPSFRCCSCGAKIWNRDSRGRSAAKIIRALP